MFSERTVDLVVHDIGCLSRLLDIHLELDKVQKELQKVLILRVATLNGKGKIGLAVLECHSGCEGGSRTLAGSHDVEWIPGLLQNEALHPLAHADTCTAGNAGRDPAAARSHRNYPAVLVGGLNRSRSGPKVLLIAEQVRFCHFLRVLLFLLRWPGFK